MTTPHRYTIQRGSDVITVECRCNKPDTPDCAGASDTDFNDWLKQVIRPGHRIQNSNQRVWLKGREVNRA